MTKYTQKQIQRFDHRVDFSSSICSSFVIVCAWRLSPELLVRYYGHFKFRLSLLSSFKPLNGTYSNPDYGFEIVFPQGWVGSEFSGPAGKIASVSTSHFGPNMLGFSGMSVMFIHNKNNNGAAMISNLTNPLGTATSQDSGSDSTEQPRCKPLSFSPVTINGIKGKEGTFNCEDILPSKGQNASINAKGFTFATNDDSLIFIFFTGSQNLYDKQLPKFEDSIKTVKISNPGDISTSETYKVYKKALSEQTNN